MHTVFALLCFVVVMHWLIFPYPSSLLHWHCGNLTIAPVPAKQPWWIWINTSCEFIMNDCITTTKQSTTKPCAYFLGYTVINLNDFVNGSKPNKRKCDNIAQVMCIAMGMNYKYPCPFLITAYTVHSFVDWESKDSYDKFPNEVYLDMNTTLSFCQ